MSNKMAKQSIFTVLPLILLSCSLMIGSEGEVPSVTELSPQEHLKGSGEIRIRFSTPMDTDSVEKGFSLSGPRAPVEGSFAWPSDRELCFRPQGIEPPSRYFLRLEGALSREGIPMVSAFTRLLSTLEEDSPPTIVGSRPQDGSIGCGSDTSILFEFSRRIDRESFYRALTVNPSISFDYLWSEEDRSVELSPRETLLFDTAYEAVLSPLCTDIEGVHLSETHRIRFHTAPAPRIELDTITIASTMTAHLPDTSQSYSIEKDDHIYFDFSEPIPKSWRNTHIEFSSSLSYFVDWEEGGKRAVLRLEEELRWGEAYTLRVGESSYVFICSGKNSRPPKVEEVLFCNHIEDGEREFLSLSHNQLLSPEDSPHAAMDLHISHAQEAELIFEEVLPHISLYASNASASLSLLSLRINPNSPPPGPYSGPGEHYSTVRLNFSIVSGESSGRLVVELSRETTDSLGNSPAEDFLLSLNL